MSKINFLYFALLALLFSSCKDDTFSGISAGDYSEGEPAILDIRVTVPDNSLKQIGGRSIETERESAVNSMKIIGFEINSGNRIVMDLTNNLTSTAVTDKAGRTYNLTNPVTTTSGRYRLYFLVNWQSVYAGVETASLENISEADLKKMIFNNADKHTDLYGNYGLPMTLVLDTDPADKKPGVLIKPESEGTNMLTGVMLKRNTAHIEFTFRNSKLETSELTPNFVPRSYTVYRIPDKTNAFITDPIAAADVTTFDAPSGPVVEQLGTGADASYSFDFYMLENLAGTVENPGTGISWREQWTGTGNDYANRKFDNAPAGATFVVVTGDYTGPAGKDADGNYNTTPYYGTVSYVIHLGNFGLSNGDFNVVRNDHQKYTITVTGANSIIANVEVNNPNASVEGNISQEPVANIDAHYAKIMLQIPTSTIYPTGYTDAQGVAHTNQIVLSTPKNGWSQETIDITALSDANDYKWIQFQKPDDKETFPTYSPSGHADLKTLVAELQAHRDNGTAPQHALVDGNNYIVAAFVDENIYSSDASMAIKDWAGHTHPARVMTLNPTTSQTDGHHTSTVAGQAAFNIHQKPIVSTYSLDPSRAPDPNTYNPFGFEQVEERTSGRTVPESAVNITEGGYGKFTDNKLFDCAYYWDGTGTFSASDVDNSNGHKMMLVHFPNAINDVNDSFYKLTNVGTGASAYTTYVFTPSSTYATVSQAIAMHNRDLNGNGKIDPEEMRWYVPGIVQYYIWNFGYDIIPRDQWLPAIEEESIEMNKPFDIVTSVTDGDRIMPRYFTSGREGRRIFWQDQRGASSGIPSTWAVALNNIKFARNLGKFADATTANYTRMAQIDEATHTITMLNPAICRSYDKVSGPYPASFALGDYNKLPYALEYTNDLLIIGKDALNTLFNNNYSSWSTASPNYQEVLDGLNTLVLNAYNTKNGTSHTELPDGWRLPNQREFLTLYVTTAFLNMEYRGTSTSTPTKPLASNVFTTDKDVNAWNLFTCTFLDSKLWKERIRLFFSDWGYFNIIKEGVTRNYNYVFLVRDVDPTTKQWVGNSTVGRGVRVRR